MRLSKVLPLFLLAFEFAVCCAQRPSPVNWTFSAGPATNHATTVSITAQVPPGWHLYSQSIKEGGPTPTSIRFAPDDDYVLQGTIAEQGEAVRFYDRIYDMEITWYSGTVTFLQRVMLTRPGATIQGHIAYMTCNNEICVPGEQPFSIQVHPEKTSPQKQ